MTNHFQHWQLDSDNQGVLWLMLNRADAAVNTLSQAVIKELSQVLEVVEAQKPVALIIASAKSTGFIAGADVSEFAGFAASDQTFDLIRYAQGVFDRLEALPIPTVAMIDGFCLGGGCELALACRYRVASSSAKTRIGLPEVKLGIQPGWGGTVRLPRLIGAQKAMSLILPGAVLSARKAKKVGLVNEVVPPRQLKRAAQHFALHPPKVSAAWSVKWSNAWGIRHIIGALIKRRLATKVRADHYPAPFAIVDNWMRYGVGPGAQAEEAASITRLIASDASASLVRLFFLQNQLKALAKNNAQPVRHVHVIGAGTMGGDIAAWCASVGLTVTLQDQTAEKIAPALMRAQRFYQKKFRDTRQVSAMMDRLIPDVAGNGVKKADLIIEAVFEDLAVKQSLFEKLEKTAMAHAILASNTSSIPLEQIASSMKEPGRLIGIHFFNPVAKMQLVEVVSSAHTDQTVKAQAMAFVGQLSKLPVPVTASPGFLVNRVLMPYLLEAMMLFEEGVAPEVIDQAALDFGMPMGPIRLADQVGLDVCLSVANILTGFFGGTVPARLLALVEQGRLGVKSGQGIYRYEKGKPVGLQQKAAIVDPEMTDRLLLRMVNEAVDCLGEGVVSSSQILDAGMVFGTGFAPFRGGPMAYAVKRGIPSVVAALHALEQKFGVRFKPSQYWERCVIEADSQGGDMQSVSLRVERAPEVAVHDL